MLNLVSTEYWQNVTKSLNLLIIYALLVERAKYVKVSMDIAI